jgi:uncharacterized protein YjbI with pentapeptide repeats
LFGDIGLSIVSEYFIELLDKGVRVWNEWRRKNPFVRPSLCEVNLYNKDLQGINFEDTNLTGSNLSLSNLKFSKLSRAIFCRATLILTDFSNSNLQSANLAYADMSSSNFESANLSYACLKSSIVTKASFHNSTLEYTNFSRVDFNGICLNQNNLSYSDLSFTDLFNAQLIFVNLSHTNFTGANFTNSCLDECIINAKTIFDDVRCEYIYFDAHKHVRYPHKGTFSQGEFKNLLQRYLETMFSPKALFLYDPIKVFISYSHQDEALREELVTHLANLRRQGKIIAWYDRAIEAGEEWEAQIKGNLESAQIILLLISPPFMASDYCYDIEMERAIARHDAGTARVIPVILRPCDWKDSPFSKLQALPKDAKAVTQWSNRDSAFLDVVQGIRRAVDSLTKK